MITYWASEVVSELFIAFRSTFLGIWSGKATARALPLSIRTLEQEVTLVFLNSLALCWVLFINRSFCLPIRS